MAQTEEHKNQDDNMINRDYMTEADRCLIDKYSNQMNYRLIPLIPSLGQPNVKMPMIACSDILSDIETKLCIQMMSIKPKPSTLRSNPENPWSIASNFELKSSSENHRMPIKVFSFIFSKETSSPLYLSSLINHFSNSFFYFRPAVNDSIKSDSDLRQYLIDSLTKILLDYCVKKDNLETSNRAQTIREVTGNVNDETSGHKYYEFRSTNEPILSHEEFMQDFQELKLCLAYKPNSLPFVPMLENLINILSFGGVIKELDGFLNFFESETHTALIISKDHLSNQNTDGVNSKFSKLFNERILLMSNETINGEEYKISTGQIYFIPGKLTYQLANSPPPCYQESILQTDHDDHH
ncbi:hypothetical protein BN7_3547 [Wickerhamomyces ciferrii]|uniref:Uncharacterized protein n=1 Tax=Wickerhamomyces ciferrii (strain ATCC 14091 / BCRC 22168 / CBS 111 / JCM 3599 / NBRC 0793 / NRRL Y-1031 F-60-10) TaxID=1206466 RepID=K0KRM7_WICCF|nr:uncharacterized protein BN7_3547 [Wickerhamomyces ciferrii]CCH43993.1 hypothetical protein BN7_3547 [Wickerhamomyces ciferrii]